MKMFSDSEDYDDVESTGYESYGEAGYSSPLSHWHDGDKYPTAQLGGIIEGNSDPEIDVKASCYRCGNRIDLGLTLPFSEARVYTQGTIYMCKSCQDILFHCATDRQLPVSGIDFEIDRMPAGVDEHILNGKRMINSYIEEAIK